MKEIRKIDKFKIAGLELDNNIFMAPLAGITDTAFRIIANELGVGLSFTEMVSAKGLYHKDKKTNILKIGRAHVELQSRFDLVCRLLLEKKKYKQQEQWYGLMFTY